MRPVRGCRPGIPRGHLDRFLRVGIDILPQGQGAIVSGAGASCHDHRGVFQDPEGEGASCSPVGAVEEDRVSEPRGVTCRSPPSALPWGS